MIKAEVSGSSIEISSSMSDALLLAISLVFVAVLVVLAGWQVAFVALGLSLIGAGTVDAVQRSDNAIVVR